MDNNDFEQSAEPYFAKLFREHGWRVEQEPKGVSYSPDLFLKKGPHSYVAELKALKDGRRDRAIALLSQAILQAQASARDFPKARPLALLWIGRAPRSLLGHVDQFLRRFANDVAAGVVISENGARKFLGDGLDELNADGSFEESLSLQAPAPISNIFSDLNQWMLKVLLAPEIPEHLLNAVRVRLRNASELAGAANVSVMSAFRFVEQLQGEGFVERAPYLKLVRRHELMDRWRASALQPSAEIKANFLLKGDMPAQLLRLSEQGACLGYHAAAQALHLGHVHGVAPYVYVRSLRSPLRDRWRELVPSAPSEPFDLVLKQPRARESVFRGAVRVDGMWVSDVIQIWLDVSAHPSRGPEQADLIWRKVLHRVVEP